MVCERSTQRFLFLVLLNMFQSWKRLKSQLIVHCLRLIYAKTSFKKCGWRNKIIYFRRFQRVVFFFFGVGGGGDWFTTFWEPRDWFSPTSLGKGASFIFAFLKKNSFLKFTTQNKCDKLDIMYLRPLTARYYALDPNCNGNIPFRIQKHTLLVLSTNTPWTHATSDQKSLLAMCRHFFQQIMHKLHSAGG